MEISILAARPFKSLRRRERLTIKEKETRRIAYAIKDPIPENNKAFAIAAAEMASLIETPCCLVPIPSSQGSLEANSKLARLIAALKPGAMVRRALYKIRVTESQCSRHRTTGTPLKPKELYIGAKCRPSLPVYFVDNVATSGNTIRAAASTLPGAGLVFAVSNT